MASVSAAGPQDEPRLGGRSAPRDADTAIRNLLALLMHELDAGAHQDYVGHYLPDGEWLSGDQRCTGRAQIQSALVERQRNGVGGPGTNSVHMLTTVYVVASAEHATATSYWQFIVNTASQPSMAAVGRYDDDLVLVDDEWMISSRRVSRQ